MVWFKKRWRCSTAWCGRASFTDALPQIPARARLTGRLRNALADAVSVADADTVLVGELPPVTALGIDETRRGRGQWERQIDPDNGEVTRRWVGRFDTGLVGLSGSGGLFAQFNGRGSDVVIDWLEQHP